ncbi:MAG TPA: hypothetical protein DCY27_08675 [Desulfobacterales bacterium]|nr:hypothetical protein [Desulfobacterales bacterium]
MAPAVNRQNHWTVLLLIYFIFSASSCVMLGNREYAQKAAPARGVVRIAVFLQRWPHFLSRDDQNAAGDGFIRDQTLFLGPFKPADRINPRAMDVLDITDADIAQSIMEVMIDKGYDPYLVSVLPSPQEKLTTNSLMARYRLVDDEVDGFLFCYYTPTLFVADSTFLPKGANRRSVGLYELAGSLDPSAADFIWSGQRQSQAPPRAITHAFIYLSMTLFNARNWQPLWMTADANVWGRIRPAIAECPPGPTDRDYWTDPAMVHRIMLRNLRCRLWHLIGDALP